MADEPAELTPPAFNRFYAHTSLPPNSGGSGDEARRYQYQAHLAPLLPRIDRVYLNPETGRYFKVRAGQQPLKPGMRFGNLVVLVTVAHCDEHGYALAWEAPPPGEPPFQIVEPHTVTLPGSSPIEAEDALEQVRLVRIAEAELAVHNNEAGGSIPWYDPAPTVEPAP